MRSIRRGLLACLGLGLLATGVPVSGQEPVVKDLLKDYLTPDGKLRSPLEVRDEKKGFGVFAGKVWRIEPDGQWTYTEIFRNRATPRAQGMLDADQVKELAKALLRFDALRLPNLGPPSVNPHVVTVSFGGSRGELIFGVDQFLIAPGPANPNVDAVGRYAGIAAMVKSLAR